MSYIGNTVENQNYVPAIDYFNGDGSTVAFTLSRPVASVAAVQAVISNVPQNPGSAFTVSGSTITFTSAPPSGTANIYVYYTSPNTQVIQPGQGTVGATQLASGAAVANIGYTPVNKAGDTVTGALEVNGALTNGGVSVVRMYQNTQSATGVGTVAWTGIPSWAKRITVSYTNVDYAASTPAVYIGSSSGYATTGYTAGLNSITSGNYPSGTAPVDGWRLNNGNCTGNVVITALGVSNLYNGVSVMGNPTNGNMSMSVGFIALASTLDRVKVEMSSGSMTSGYITLTYEG